MAFPSMRGKAGARGHVAISKTHCSRDRRFFLSLLPPSPTRREVTFVLPLSPSLSEAPCRRANSGHKLGTRDQKSWRENHAKIYDVPGSLGFPHTYGIPRRYLFSAVLHGIYIYLIHIHTLSLSMLPRFREADATQYEHSRISF